MKIIDIINTHQRDKLLEEWPDSINFIRKKPYDNNGLYELLLSKKSIDILGYNLNYNLLRKEYKDLLYSGPYSRQVDPLNKVLAYKGGIVNLPMRFGKTAIATMYASNESTYKSLIVVDKQKINEFKDFIVDELNVDRSNVITLHDLQGKEKEVIDTINELDSFIVLTTIDGLRKHSEKINGLRKVVIDEFHSHITNRNETHRKLEILKENNQNIEFLFLSATPINKDKVENIFWLAKLFDNSLVPSPWINTFLTAYSRIPNQYRTVKKEMSDLFNDWLSHLFCEIKTDFDPYESLIAVKHELKRGSKKLDWVIDRINKYPDASRIIIAYQKEEIKSLHKELLDNGIKTEVITGEISKEKRESLYKDFRDKKYKVVILQQLLSRGVSLDVANETIIYDTNYDLRSIFQSSGRMISTKGNNEFKVINIPIEYKERKYYRKAIKKEEELKSITKDTIAYPTIYKSNETPYILLVDSIENKKVYKDIFSNSLDDVSNSRIEYRVREDLFIDNGKDKFNFDLLDKNIQSLNLSGTLELEFIFVQQINEGNNLNYSGKILLSSNQLESKFDNGEYNDSSIFNNIELKVKQEINITKKNKDKKSKFNIFLEKEFSKQNWYECRFISVKEKRIEEELNNKINESMLEKFT